MASSKASADLERRLAEIRNTARLKAHGTAVTPVPDVFTPDSDEYPLAWIKRVLTRALWSQRYFWTVAGLDLDTEIDFTTYMQQAKMFNNGERIYSRITGNTGPCVYPALHLYISSLMYYATNGGSDIMTGQIIYAGLYIICQTAVMATYKAAKIPPIILPLLILSRRLHSIFVLRLFNDCWAMTFFYLGVWTMCKGRWRTGSTLYSLALAVKMNILLYAPAMAVIYLRALGLQRSIIEALRVILIQVVLAFPFLRQDTRSYFSSAFNLSRQFLYKWTVNLRFLDEETFLNGRVARILLGAHIVLCAIWLLYRWTGTSQIGLQWIRSNLLPPNKFNTSRSKSPSGRFIVSALYTSNLIGIIFSRSLHYQFYSWYAQQIPLLVYLSSLPMAFKILIPLCIEAAWNTYPSTAQSSLLLLIAHLVLLAGLWKAKQDDAITDETRRDLDKEVEEMARKWDRISQRPNGDISSQKTNKAL